jgi:hypothetical protein
MTLPLGATASTEAANSKVAVIGEATMGADADADGTIDDMTYVVGGTTETIANPEEE